MASQAADAHGCCLRATTATGPSAAASLTPDCQTTAAATRLAVPVAAGAIIGFIGVALTGSATTCNVIFGSLQVVAANAIGLNPVQMAATNTAAGQIGHIISTSSMVIAAVASGQSAKSIGPIAKSVIGYGIAEMVLFGCWNLLVAHVFPQLIPSL